mgnify:CR=1 FL=1
MKKLCIFLLLLFAATGILFAQEIEKSVKERLSNYFETYTPASANTGSCKLKSVDIDFEGRKLSIYASESFAYQPFVPETVDEIYHQIEELLPGPVRFFRTTIYANNQPIEELIPNFFRGKKKKDKSRLSNAEYKGAPWVINTSRPYEITKGLQNRHISLWQSHGKYYKNDKGEWGWQRPRLFCTTEDLFTQSFILPYVIPMLENAGANVYTPPGAGYSKE